MVDSVNSGYKAEIQTVAFGTGLNTLASATWSELSSEIDNSLTGYSFMDLFLDLGGSAAFDGTIDVYVVPSIDGTNYPDWVGSGTADAPQNNTYYIGSFTVDGTSAKLVAETDFKMPQGKFKFGLRNQSGVATSGAANWLKWRPWNWGAR